MLRVAREQRVPLRSPEHLDHVPAGAGEQRFQLLDDLAIAAHRPVEPLQLQLMMKVRLSRRSRAARVSAPTDSGSSISPSPNTPQTRRSAVVGEAAILEVAQETRLIDRADRPDAHRAGRKLPEIRHQPGMRVGAQAAAADLLPVFAS